jgi:hypothetical protein
MVQETLEEAFDKIYNSIDFTEFDFASFKLGANWQQERMYSKSIEFAEWIRIKDFQTSSKDKWIGLDMQEYTSKELFNQFKNK